MRDALCNCADPAKKASRVSTNHSQHCPWRNLQMLRAREEPLVAKDLCNCGSGYCFDINGDWPMALQRRARHRESCPYRVLMEGHGDWRQVILEAERQYLLSEDPDATEFERMTKRVLRRDVAGIDEEVASRLEAAGIDVGETTELLSHEGSDLAETRDDPEEGT